MDRYLGIVDADSILYKVAYVTEEETEEEAFDTLRAVIYKTIYQPTRCEEYIFCFSGDDNFREDVAVTKPYKGNRVDKPKPKHLKALKKYAMAEYNGLILSGLEADDIVVAIHQKYAGTSVLIGIDKDAKQSVGHHYNFGKDIHFYVTPEQAEINLQTQMVTGDTVDNITGLPGYGPKKAEKLFNSSPETAPSRLVYDLYKELGYDEDYYLEQLTLLYMKRDIVYPFEEHFIKLAEKGGADEFTFD